MERIAGELSRGPTAHAVLGGIVGGPEGYPPVEIAYPVPWRSLGLLVAVDEQSCSRGPRGGCRCSS